MLSQPSICRCLKNNCEKSKINHQELYQTEARCTSDFCTADQIIEYTWSVDMNGASFVVADHEDKFSVESGNLFELFGNSFSD